MKLALNMIVKDNSEAKLLYRCLSSVAPYVDGIFITFTKKPYDEAEKIARNFGAITSFYEWDKSFEKARNYAMSRIPPKYKYMVWCDADDVWANASKFKDVLRIMDQQKLTAVFFDYNYQISKDNEVEIVHPRERIIKLGLYEWKGHLHETLIPKGHQNASYYKDIKVNHFPTEQATIDNLKRNLEILENTYKEEGEKHDPRTEYYLARNYFDVERFEDAYRLFSDYLGHSGWDEERAMAHNYMGLIRLGEGNFDEAKKHFLEAVAEDPDVPAWYINLAYLYALQQRFDEATHYARLFVNVPQPKSAMVQTPIDDKMRYFETLFLIAVGKRKLEEALQACEEALKVAPESKSFQDRYAETLKLQRLVEVTKAVEILVLELGAQKEESLIPNILSGLPSSISDNAYVEQLRQKHLPNRTWPAKSIVYWAGKSFEEWTPDSLKTGLGGSETAIVHLSKQWVKLGYKVTVYGNCGKKEGNYDGVEYLNYWKFNRRDVFDTLVIWRAPWEMDFKFKANKIILDLHDVPDPTEFTQERLENIDKIYVKSKYHRSLLPSIPDDKFVIIPNGVDPIELGDVKRNEKQLIYASSYDRGLELLLTYGWPVIKKAIPDATLKVYYGWNLFDAVHRHNPERMMWKARIVDLLSQDGVTEGGRIGHKELLKQKASSAIHYYPTNFEEIDCISVRESALVGAIPFTTDYAALEGRAYCMTTKGDPNAQETQVAIARNIVEYLKEPSKLDPIRGKFKELALDESWERIARRWFE